MLQPTEANSKSSKQLYERNVATIAIQNGDFTCYVEANQGYLFLFLKAAHSLPSKFLPSNQSNPCSYACNNSPASACNTHWFKINKTQAYNRNAHNLFMHTMKTTRWMGLFQKWDRLENNMSFGQKDHFIQCFILCHLKTLLHHLSIYNIQMHTLISVGGIQAFS